MESEEDERGATGRRILELRTAKGMSRADLRRAARYQNDEALRKVEVDGATPSPPVLVRIARALGTTVEQLVTGEAERPLSRPAMSPPARDVEEWVAQLPGPSLAAAEVARTAWRMAAESALIVPRATQTPTMTPPMRSASQELVADSGMRAKKRKSAAPAKRKARR